MNRLNKREAVKKGVIEESKVSTSRGGVKKSRTSSQTSSPQQEDVNGASQARAHAEEAKGVWTNKKEKESLDEIKEEKCRGLRSGCKKEPVRPTPWLKKGPSEHAFTSEADRGGRTGIAVMVSSI